MDEWIPFEEGDYLVEKAYLVTVDDTATPVENAVIRVYYGRGGKKYMAGDGLVQNMLLVELLDVSDDVDLILDFGGEYKYRMERPDLKAGKVFSPDVKSMVHIIPSKPWLPLSEEEHNRIISKLKIL